MIGHDEAVLLITVLSLTRIGEPQKALLRAEALLLRVVTEPPKVHNDGVVALAAAQMMETNPALTEDQAIYNAKNVYAFVQQRSRERIRQQLARVTRQAPAARPAVSQADGFSAEGGIGETQEHAT
jgi:hypothetical protein